MSREIAEQILRIEGEAILALLARLDASFDRAVELILKRAGRVVVSGMGKSGIIGRKIAATLSSTGTPAYFLHPAEAVHGDLGMLVPGDLVVALSHSGETREILRLLELVRRLDLRIIALVGERSSTLAQMADASIDVSVAREACPLGLAPTASTTAALAMGDALALTLAAQRGFTSDDFARRHPGGRLGSRLARVEDLMARGEAMPRVTQDAPMLETIAEMSRKGMGMTAVVDSEGRLLGVLTDGDLRRLIERGTDFARARAGQVCTRSPKTIARDESAARALALLEEWKITSLPVADAEARLEGVLHMHALWRLELF